MINMKNESLRGWNEVSSGGELFLGLSCRVGGGGGGESGAVLFLGEV